MPPIPGVADFLRPILMVLEDMQPRTSKEIRAELVRQLGLTPEQLEPRTPSGSEPVWQNNVSFALVGLQRRDQIRKLDSGSYEITAEGVRELAASGGERASDSAMTARSARRLTSREAVLEALAEHDSIGRKPFLAKYGFREAREVLLVYEGRSYDSKPILGAAFGYQFPELGPLRASEFNGGAETTNVLTGLGFQIEREARADRVTTATSSWDQFLTLAGALLNTAWFDEQERDYKLQATAQLRQVLEEARDDGDWKDRLDRVFRSGLYNLTNWRQNTWFLEWADTNPRLGQLVGGFLEEARDPTDRFRDFADLAETEGVAAGNAGSVLAFGSLFNFAAAPASLPLVRARVFETLERRLGWETVSAPPADRYGSHVAFANEARSRMENAGLPVRDMLDVQSVLWVLSQPDGPQLRRLGEEGHAAEVEAWRGASVIVRPEQAPGYVEPSIDDVTAAIQRSGLRLDDQTLRRYHLSLRTRGFVVLSGPSGSGKTWLAEEYAAAVGARSELVPVAPNWTTNEDLLGYLDPLSNEYRHTRFSEFLLEATAEFQDAQAQRRAPQPFHLILDEMNLARVEYYFAKFLSAMEVRARTGIAVLELAPGEPVTLTPNLRFIGTVNIDETTFGFADKVYDRAQLLELDVSEPGIQAHLRGKPYAEDALKVWKVMRTAAPFAYRVLDEIASYVDHATALQVPWRTAFDEQLLQKVLPKVKGMEHSVGEALAAFVEIAKDAYPLSYRKAVEMHAAYSAHGFVSYF